MNEQEIANQISIKEKEINELIKIGCDSGLTVWISSLHPFLRKYKDFTEYPKVKITIEKILSLKK